MKKSELAILSVLILAAVFVFNGKINKVTNPCVQDYVAGQGNIRGNVNVEDYYERDARFAIGAGEDGYAVFKDPGEAFAALREHYPEGISLIRKEFHLLWLSKLNYPSYQTYGWQATTGSEEARQQAQFVSRFFDIYENSFRFLYKGIIIKHNKTEPTYTKTSLFLCEKRRFFMARTEKGVVTTI